MMHSKNKAGFLMIEAMLAITIVGLILTPLFLLQGTLLDQIADLSTQMHQIFFAKQFLFKARRAQPENIKDFTLEHKEEDPTTFLKYELKPVNKNSSLKNIKHLFIEQISAQENPKKKGIVLVNLVYKPEHVI